MSKTIVYYKTRWNPLPEITYKIRMIWHGNQVVIPSYTENKIKSANLSLLWVVPSSFASVRHICFRATASTRSCYFPTGAKLLFPIKSYRMERKANVIVAFFFVKKVEEISSDNNRSLSNHKQVRCFSTNHSSYQKSNEICVQIHW